MADVPRKAPNRTLVVMPEDLGLLAAFTGARGVPARAVNPQTGGLTAAVATLLVSYGTQNAYYLTHFPELGTRGLPTRALALGLTDTFGRVAVETYAELADRYDVWLAAGVNMARDWRIVCRDAATFVPPPGATGCDATDPALVGALGDPGEPERDYAYEATGPEPVNMALVFDPQGKLVAKRVKSYLTPIELPGQLDLAPGDPDADVRAVRTPVGRLGFVTSKDAWMPDVTGRLDADGTEILVQPEFFVGDTVRASGPWAPDTLLAAGFSDLQRHPSLQALALPELTGDVYDFSADAQSHIAVRSKPGGPSGRLVGQERSPGIVKVQRWLAKDPVGLPIRQRRRRLGRAGEAAVGAGTQPEGILYQDVKLGRKPRQVSTRRRDVPLAPTARDQTNVDIAAQKKVVYAAWEERGQVWTSLSRNRGETFREAVSRGPGKTPSVSVGRGNSLWLAFERSDGRVVVAEGNGRAQPVSRNTGAEQQVPDIAALDSDGAYVVWIDNQTGLFGTYGAIVGDVPERLDQGEPVPLAEQMDNSYAPSVHARAKQVLVTWTDFRNYQWDVYSRTSEDRGDSFQPQIKVNDTPEGVEALNDSPQATVLRGDPFVVWTDFRKRPTPAPSTLYDIYGARPAQRNQRLDGDGSSMVNAFGPAVSEMPGGSVALAWQSNRGPTADIALREITTGSRLRVDDAGTRDVNSSRPSIATMIGREVIVAWEDDRDGPSNIFYRRLVLP